VEGMFPQDEIG